MGPILVIGAGLLAVLWFTGWLTPLRLRWAGAAIAALAGLRLLAMGQTLVAAGLFMFAGWLGYGARTLTQNLPLAEARRCLGVDENAGEAEINAAYRRLITGAHPDKGGSEALSRQINMARDTLLKHLRGTGR